MQDAFKATLMIILDTVLDWTQLFIYPVWEVRLHCLQSYDQDLPFTFTLWLWFWSPPAVKGTIWGAELDMCHKNRFLLLPDTRLTRAELHTNPIARINCTNRTGRSLIVSFKITTKTSTNGCHIQHICWLKWSWTVNFCLAAILPTHLTECELKHCIDIHITCTERDSFNEKIRSLSMFLPVQVQI